MNEKDQTKFRPAVHAKYFKRHLLLLPPQAESKDTQRLTLAFFAISGIDVLGKLDVLNDCERDDIKQWIYRLQIVPDEKGEDSWQRCGFLGSSTVTYPAHCSPEVRDFACGHLAMTYMALSILVILGDDLSGIHREAIVRGVRALQQPDGSFCALLGGSENDMRFVYCAACICHMMQDWSGMDRDLTQKFIRDSLTYEGGIAQGPGLEAHGGTTFCAVAALCLMGRLESCFTPQELQRLRHWCLMRQESGFQGRPNKPQDTCYSFWVGATLELLGVFHLTDFKANRAYIMSTEETITGGFGKWENTCPDTLHAYFGVCGLSLMGEPDLQPLYPALNISRRAADHLHTLHARWRK